MLVDQTAAVPSRTPPQSDPKRSAAAAALRATLQLLQQFIDRSRDATRATTARDLKSRVLLSASRGPARLHECTTRDATKLDPGSRARRDRPSNLQALHDRHVYEAGLLQQQTQWGLPTDEASRSAHKRSGRSRNRLYFGIIDVPELGIRDQPARRLDKMTIAEKVLPTNSPQVPSGELNG